MLPSILLLLVSSGLLDAETPSRPGTYVEMKTQIMSSFSSRERSNHVDEAQHRWKPEAFNLLQLVAVTCSSRFLPTLLTHANALAIRGYRPGRTLRRGTRRI